MTSRWEAFFCSKTNPRKYYLHNLRVITLLCKTFWTLREAPQSLVKPEVSNANAMKPCESVLISMHAFSFLVTYQPCPTVINLVSKNKSEDTASKIHTCMVSHRPTKYQPLVCKTKPVLWTLGAPYIELHAPQTPRCVQARFVATLIHLIKWK